MAKYVMALDAVITIDDFFTYIFKSIKIKFRFQVLIIH